MNTQALDVWAPWVTETVTHVRLSPIGLEVWFADGLRSTMSAEDVRERAGGWPTGVDLDEDAQTVVLRRPDGGVYPMPWDGFRFRADASYRAAMQAFALDTVQTIGRRIRRWRKHLGWTQAALTDAAGLSRITLSRIENGNQEATLPTLRAIAAAMGVGVGEMMATTPDSE